VNAGADVLKVICGDIMYISGLLCFVGDILSYKKMKNNHSGS
jgi:hypothetical protein